MANKFTYDQFEQAARNSGLYGQFSEADLAYARQNPDFGMSILDLKQQYANTTDPAERARLHQMGENLRASYGNYTGGQDGSGFVMEQLSPSSFDAGTAPSYTNNYSDEIANQYNQLSNYSEYNYSGAKPTYTDAYAETVDRLLGEAINRDDFAYNLDTDPLYSAYRKQYLREGQRAIQDTLGAAAAASGGIPSSYAVSAAQQAGNYYNAQLTDKIPQLYQLAYNKYMNDHQMELGDLAAAQGVQQTEYNKYLNELQQYNTDRNFDYNAWTDRYNMINNNLNAASALEQAEYNKYLNDLQQYNTDRTFNYQQLLDEIDSQTRERQEALQFADLQAQYGDESGLRAQGVDVQFNPYAEQIINQQIANGLQMADLGPAIANGYNPQVNPALFEQQYNIAIAAWNAGDPEPLNALLGANADLAYMNNQALASRGEYYGGSGGSGGQYYDGGINNYGYSDSAIIALQQALGVSADGLFGPNSHAAMYARGYNNIDEAMAALVPWAASGGGSYSGSSSGVGSGSGGGGTSSGGGSGSTGNSGTTGNTGGGGTLSNEAVNALEVYLKGQKNLSQEEFDETINILSGAGVDMPEEEFRHYGYTRKLV